MTLREQVIQQALSLPESDRAAIVDALEQSLPADAFVSPECAAEWMDEISRRANAAEQGSAPSVDATTALENIRRRLQESRERNRKS